MRRGDLQQQLNEQKHTEPREYDHLFKFVLLGDSGVGKSCLLLRYADDTYTENYIATIGVDYRTVTRVIDDKRCKLQIWDPAGQERFRTVGQNNYYRGAHGIVIAFDMCDEQSFQNARNWMSEIQSRAPENISVILVGTKSDLTSRQEVSAERAQLLAREWDIPFFATSAKSNTGVQEAFSALARQVLNERLKPKVQSASVLPLPLPQPEAIGIGQKIANIFLWPFEKIWAGLKFMGRGMLALGRGLASLFSRSQNNGARQPAAGPQEIKTTSAEITAAYQAAQRQSMPPLVPPPGQGGSPANIHRSVAAPVPATPAADAPPPPTAAALQELGRQREAARLRADIATFDRLKAEDEEKAARSVLQAVSVNALIDRQLGEQQQNQRRAEEDPVVGPDHEENNDDVPSAPGQDRSAGPS